MRIRSIKARLIATVILSQALLAAGLVIAGQYYTYRRLLATLDSNLQAHAMSVGALVRYTEDGSGNIYFDDTLVPSSIDPHHPDLFSVWADHTGLLTRSANWPPGFYIQPVGRDHWNFKFNKVHYRGMRVAQVPILDREEGSKFRPQSLTIIYASPTHEIDEQVNATGVFIALMSIVLLAVTVLFAFLGVRRGLLPLQDLAARSALVSAHHWKLEVPASTREISELGPLTESMTRMLSRLETSFFQQREFVANAAHELKTPIAVLKSTLQSLVQRPRNSYEYRAGVEAALEDLSRLEQLLSWMLTLARAEQWTQRGMRANLKAIDIADSCEAALDRIRPLAEQKNVKLGLRKNGQVSLHCDPEDLQLIWVNVLENAVRHSGRGSSVEVSLHKDDTGAVRVAFRDYGEGIPAGDLPHIFDRFYRGDPSRTRSTGGFGLGLAIAKAIVESYGGSITAKSVPAEGTEILVKLPADEIS